MGARIPNPALIDILLHCFPERALEKTAECSWVHLKMCGYFGNNDGLFKMFVEIMANSVNPSVIFLPKRGNKFKRGKLVQVA